MKVIPFIALFLLVITLQSAEVQAQQYPKAVTDVERWSSVDFTAPAACTASPEECAVKMLGELKIEIGDEPEFSVYPLGDKDGKDVTVVFVSHMGEEDDSVLGVLYRMELNMENAAFSLNGLGRMFQCLDGPAGWRKTACQ
jgi:hypothetical protein